MSEKTCGKNADGIKCHWWDVRGRPPCCRMFHMTKHIVGDPACTDYEPSPPPALLQALEEMTAACAAATRVLAENQLAEDFVQEAKRVGVKDGFGVRAKKALAEYEGGA